MYIYCLIIKNYKIKKIRNNNNYLQNTGICGRCLVAHAQCTSAHVDSSKMEFGASRYSCGGGGLMSSTKRGDGVNILERLEALQ